MISSDPYIIVEMGKHKLKTRLVKLSVNPEWDEKLTNRFRPKYSSQALCV